ncbi:MAG: M48 family metalloprotease [Myxococcales bacterium]|jgi:predicted Zn-dependent protease|nr:M48 family metalloprotease [Myxococcales bacterium]
MTGAEETPSRNDAGAPSARGAGNGRKPRVPPAKALFVQGVLLAWLAVGCATSPFTGRRSFQLLPEAQVQELGASEYQNILEQSELTDNERLAAQVRRIGERIALAAEVALEGEGDPGRLEGYEWEFNVVESDEVNAFCLPGGKVVVYTGLLTVARDEDSLAVVMGHEIAHAIAEHGNERMSQVMAAQLGGVALDVALQDRPTEVRQLFATAFGVGATVGVLLPFSRTHEREADEIGLFLSTIAGYDPRAAAPLWERMAKVAASAPEFLSTHPDPLERAERLRELVPEALEYREKYGPELERRVRAADAQEKKQERKREKRDASLRWWPFVAAAPTSDPSVQ